MLSVRTDLAPGAQMARVVAEVTTAEGATEGRFELAADASRDWGLGVRLAELALPAGRHRARVAALDAGGAVIVERPVSFEIGAGVRQVTVWLTRDCAGVVCPAAGDPTRTACLAGRCVAEGCTEEAAAACDPPACGGAADCGPAPAGACARRECSPSRACVDVLDHAACGATEVCDADAGCVGEALGTLSPPSDDGHAHVIALEGGARLYRVELRPGAPSEDVSARLDAVLPPMGSTYEDGPAGLSNDGEWLVFSGRRAGCEDCLFLAPVRDLSRAETLPFQSDINVALVDVVDGGDTIVYTAPDFSVRRLDRAGGSWTEVGRLDAMSPHALGFGPSLTPDDARVIFQCGDDAVEPRRAAGICEVSIDGGAVTVRVAAGHFGPDQVVYSPRETADGGLLFTTSDAGVVASWWVPPGSTTPEPAANDLPEVESFCVLPDGRLLGRVVGEQIEVLSADGRFQYSVAVDFPGSFAWFIDACGR